MSEEDGMPLVNRGGVGSMCRTTSCIEDPQASAVQCVVQGDLRLLSDILSDSNMNIDVDKTYKEHSFKTLLQLAVEQDNIQMVGILLRGGADPCKVNPILKTTPVHLAAAQGKGEILTLLVDTGGTQSLQVKDNAGRIPLHHAVLAASKYGDKGMNCIRICVSNGSQINAPDNKGGQTPLYIAAANKVFPAVKYLIENGADPSLSCQGVVTRKLIIDNFSISQAAELNLNRPENVEAQNPFDVIKQLLNKAELDGQNEHLFRQKLNGVKLSDIESKSGEKKSLVQQAAEQGLDIYLKLLLEKGLNPNETTRSNKTTALNLAAINAHKNVLKVLLGHENLLKTDTEPKKLDLNKPLAQKRLNYLCMDGQEYHFFNT